MVVVALHLKTHVLLQGRVQAEVVVTAGQINTGSSHSLTWSIRQPGEGLVEDLAVRRILIDGAHINVKPMATVTLWNHKSTHTLLGALHKPADGAALQILAGSLQSKPCNRQTNPIQAAW